MHDNIDERGIPVSGGIPPVVIVAAVVGLIMIFSIGTMVFANSGFGHAWPSTSAVTIPLQQ